MQTRSYGSDRAFQRLRGLDITHFLQVAEHHRLAVAQRQRHHRASQLLNLLGVGQRSQRIARRGCPGRRRVVPLGERFELALLFHPPPHKIARDAEEPCHDGPAIGVVTTGVTHHGEKHILRHVFSGRRRPGHMQRKAVNGGPLPAKQRGKGLRIACGNARQQRAVLGRVAHS